MSTLVRCLINMSPLVDADQQVTLGMQGLGSGTMCILVSIDCGGTPATSISQSRMSMRASRSLTRDVPLA
jgi:hypothetical protein